MIESSIIVNEHNTSFELLVSVLALLFLLMLTLLLLSRESFASVRILSRNYLFICKVFYRISKYPVFFSACHIFFWKHKQPYSNCVLLIYFDWFFFSFHFACFLLDVLMLADCIRHCTMYGGRHIWNGDCIYFHIYKFVLKLAFGSYLHCTPVYLQCERSFPFAILFSFIFCSLSRSLNLSHTLWLSLFAFHPSISRSVFFSGRDSFCFLPHN